MSNSDAENDIERGVYQTPSNDDDFYDDYDDEDGIGRGPVIAIFFVILMAAFVGVIWLAYNMGVRQGQQAAPPIIQASNLPFKSEPDDAGGLDEPIDTPSTVTLAGNDLGEDVSIGASAEEPIEIPRDTITLVGNSGASDSAAPIVPPPTGNVGTIEPEVASATPDIIQPEVAVPTQTESEPEPIVVAQPTATPTARPSVNPAQPSTDAAGQLIIPRPSARVLDADATESLTRNTAALSGPSTTTTTQPNATRPATTQPAVATSQPSTVTTAPQTEGPPAPGTSSSRPTAAQNAPSGNFVVQVASFPEIADADAAWQRLRSRHGAVIGNSVQDVQTADLGDRGTWYRLRIGYFETRADANDVCERLQANNQDCLVVSR